MSDSPKKEKENLFTSPVFFKPLKDLTSPQGECLVLECRVKGVPPPSVTWQREGHVIEDSLDFRILHRGEIATLVIGEVYPEDTGIFTCEATNKAGSARTSCKITIKGSGYNSISTKAAAASTQRFQQPRPTQVLPTAQQTSCIYTSSTTSSVHQVKTETHISHLNIVPKNPRRVHAAPSSGDEKKTYNSQLVTSPLLIERTPTPHSAERASPSSTPTQSPAPLQTQPSTVIKSSSITSFSSPASKQVTMATSTCTIQPVHNSDENHNFKAEKDQLVQEVANVVSTPPQQKQGKQKRPSREMAIIERDIELRHSMAVASPTSSQHLDAQEYKISTFEQRLMSEIEYRLERTPPVNEDPEDGIFEDVSVNEQVAPTFTARLKNFKAMDGTSTKFLCRVAAKPKAKVYWFKDGKQISKRSQHYLQRNDGEGGHELYIPHLCMEDDGNYTALATNPQGRASSTGRLAMVSERGFSNDVRSPTNVIPKQSISSPRMTSPLSPTARMVLPDVTSPGVPSTQVTSPRLTSPGVTSPVSPNSGAFTLPPKGELAADEESPIEKYYRPTFIQKPAADTKADEGKLVRFDVKVTGLPTPEIEWLINGRPVIQDALHKILVRENNVHSLLFDRVSRMDEGQYTITASNKAGNAVTHVQLHVTPREQMTAPAFVQRLAGQCVAEGDSIRLEARVVATPRPIICWKRGSDQVLPSGRIQLYEDDSGYVCLQITQAHANDAAWYTCSATNKAGISSCNCKLDVYSPTANVPSNRRRIRTPHRYANLAKVAGVDMREALTPDAQPQHMLPESEEL